MAFVKLLDPTTNNSAYILSNIFSTFLYAFVEHDLIVFPIINVFAVIYAADGL